MNNLISTLMGILIFTSVSFAESGSEGWLRKKFKDRMIKNQQSKPAPEARKDISSKIEKPGDYTFTFSFNGADRYYKVHVPSKYDAKTSWPVVFVLHGGGGDMQIQSSDEISHQVSVADREGYIVVFPNGSSPFKSGKLATWNAGNCCAFARDQKIDDVGFIKAVLKNLTAQLNVDQAKVFADGMSNGGMMSYRLACEAADIFKAIASVAGTDVTTSCSPKNPISILHIHAQDDDHVLFNGGAGKNAFPDRSMVTEFTSVPDTISKWSKLNGCEGKAERFLQKPGYYCEKFAKCKATVQLQLCVTETGGHSWPGGKNPRRGKADPSDAFSATDLIWDFFKSQK